VVERKEKFAAHPLVAEISGLYEGGVSANVNWRGGGGPINSCALPFGGKRRACSRGKGKVHPVSKGKRKFTR